MRRVLYTIVAVLLALALWVQTGCIRREPVEVGEEVQRRTMRVSGSSRAEARPDMEAKSSQTSC
jgi:hypothetical protein